MPARFASSYSLFFGTNRQRTGLPLIFSAISLRFTVFSASNFLRPSSVRVICFAKFNHPFVLHLMLLLLPPQRADYAAFPFWEALCNKKSFEQRFLFKTSLATLSLYAKRAENRCPAKFCNSCIIVKKTALCQAPSSNPRQPLFPLCRTGAAEFLYWKKPALHTDRMAYRLNCLPARRVLKKRSGDRTRLHRIPFFH